MLASVGVGVALPGAAAAAPDPGQAAPPRTDLARFRPVTASSTAYAAAPPEFAVDGLAVTGVRGSGWRAEAAGPQWLIVDLQAQCRIEAVRLVFEARLTDPAYVPGTGWNPFSDTDGSEILSSAATAFRLEVSDNGTAWRTVYETGSGPGGQVDIALPTPATGRWVRLSTSRTHNTNPLGLNGFEVYGSTERPRPAVKGWTDWGRNTRPAPALTVGKDGTVPLESGWSLTMDEWAGSSDGAALSGPSIDTTTWLPASVPGTVLADLVDQGHLPDPVSGQHNLHIPEALSRHSWWYRRAFTVPRELDVSAGRQVWLELDGVNHHGEVWLNGHKVGTVTSPFARAHLNITEALKAGNGKHNLAIRVDPMPHPGTAGDKGADGLAFLHSGKLYLDSPTYLAASGWDWMPAVRDRGAGLWNHVRLRSTGSAVFGDPRVETTLPNLPDTGLAEVKISVPVRNPGAAPVSVVVQASFGAISLRSTVTVPAGGSANAVFTPAEHPALRLRDPKLWWPNGYGDPSLHDLTLTATVGGVRSDRRSLRFGIRQFGYGYDIPIKIDPATNSARQTVEFARVQARHVRILCHTRATGWGNSMWSLSVVDSAKPEVDLALGKTASASSVDNPGNAAGNVVDGNTGTRWSSEYTDNQWIQVDLGADTGFDRVVLLWETAYAKDFTVQTSADGQSWTEAKKVSNAPIPLRISVNGVQVYCRGGNWGWDELLRRMIPDRMDAVVKMHRDMNFTMIRNWIGSSYREELFAQCDEQGILVWNDFWEAGAFLADPPGYVDVARDTILRYRTHPCIVVWCAANEQHPPPAIHNGIAKAIAEEHSEILYMPDSAGGFVSGHGPYYWVEPAKYFEASTYDTNNFGFHTEIGMPTIPVVESMRNLVGKDNPGWPIDITWFHHDWSTKGNQRPQTYLEAINTRLGESTSLAEFCRKAQFVNYENMRAMFEAWTANLWQDANALLLWMSHPAWHSTVWQTYDYDLDVNGSYYGARKGCEAVHVQANPDGRVVAANHTTTAITGATVKATLFDLNGKQLGDPQSQQLAIAASNITRAFTVPFGAELPALHLLRLVLSDGNGKVLSENTYWRYRKPEDMRQLNTLAQTRVSVRVGEQRPGKLTATLRNEGRTVAALVRLSVRDRRSGERVLPVTYSDNYLWLLPGESRTITATWNPAKQPSGTPNLVVEGYNTRN
ncbi:MULTISPECIES: discoidin domain-containing protein [unclassified Crossiella]|uniref:discoidin domain-containing protein n=1 Tax=unclassified Crossiella TaxID=2620835 RepID=UPI001FFFD23B|nr:MULTISPECIES: discoidin domain-containing protein [unclassified Crossiella]MCK2244687.1 discoidin domain-containing protein [Crossiella sp. S99.2]MCK2258326.1 discoidin domain-containing protein [Crossiella sp. S99.1]